MDNKIYSTAIDEGKDALANVAGIIQSNPLTSAVVATSVGVVAAGGVLGAVAAVKKRRKKKSVKRRKNINRRTRRARRRKSSRRRYTPHTAGKRKDTSHKRIRYTKNGQPYIILRSGKARFIKQTSAKRSHRQKGGRY